MNKTLKSVLLILAVNFVVLFVLLELFFRFIVPASSPPFKKFYEENKLLAYSNEIKNGTYTKGKTGKAKTRWHVNNKGWVYPVDYKKTDKKLIAVIGDSFVASDQLDYDKYFPYLLRKKIYNQYEVYSFGYPAASLAQYLQISRYVNKYFDPDIMVFNIVGSDMADSLSGVSLTPRFLSIYVNKEGMVTEIAPAEKTRPYLKFLKRILSKSALFRYVYFNLKFNGLVKNYGGGHQRDATLDNKLIEIAADYLIGKIREENPDKRIIFILAPPQNIIYEPEAHNEEFYLLDKIAKKACIKYEIEIIDLALPMQEDYKINKRQFDFGEDLHWNEYGHEFVASLLYDHLQK
ncbi:MAG: SGNH/GDSL hydrolase family protein [Candidatus Omnitrophota bacterium]|jgi:lysophospholipase L1-like esterase